MTRVRLHLPVLLGVPGCLAAGWFELGRATAGRAVAWVYAVEWPMFAVMGVYIWWRLLHAPAEPVPRQEPVRCTPAADPALAAWQEHLAGLQAADPPGGPSDAPPAGRGRPR